MTLRFILRMRTRATKMAASTNAVGIEDNMEEEERRERGEATESGDH